MILFSESEMKFCQILCDLKKKFFISVNTLCLRLSENFFIRFFTRIILMKKDNSNENY